MRAALPLVVAALSLVGLGCPDDEPLSLETQLSPAFDPLRFDAGAMPELKAPAPQKLTFGITPFYSPERQQRMLARVRDYLETRVGVPVETRVFPSYAACVAALDDGALDFAQLSPLAYVRAEREIPGLIPLASAVAQGTTTYASYLAVRSDSVWRNIDDARGARIGFTDQWSTSGYLYPVAWLKERDLDPDRMFQVSFHKTHDAALEALLDRRIDIAAVSSDTLVSNKVIGIAAPVRVLAKTGRIPYDAVVVTPRMAPALRERLRRAFLSLSILDDDGRAVLEDYNLINGFMPVPKGHYDEVRALEAAMANGGRLPGTPSAP